MAWWKDADNRDVPSPDEVKEVLCGQPQGRRLNGLSDDELQRTLTDQRNDRLQRITPREVCSLRDMVLETACEHELERSRVAVLVPRTTISEAEFLRVTRAAERCHTCGRITDCCCGPECTCSWHTKRSFLKDAS
jgi:hypothetical protein